MYVENVSLKGTKIDKDTHKVYTKSGDIVKYHVWPALYLHYQDGTKSPLMGKGVVQPEYCDWLNKQFTHFRLDSKIRRFCYVFIGVTSHFIF